MKKLAILTSVLVLSACGGSVGGPRGALVPDMPNVPEVPEIPSEPDVKNTFTLVDDVVFYGNNIFVTNDKGEIEGLYSWDDYQSIKYNLEPGTSRVVSIDGRDDDVILENAGIQMYGKHVGLRFADFGMVYEKSYYLDYGVGTTWDVIAGRVPGREIEEITEAKKFKGSAVAVIGSDYSFYPELNDILVTDTDDAVLSFYDNTGEYLMTMDFTKSDGEKWYKVDHYKKGDKEYVVFTNPENIEIKDEFKVLNSYVSTGVGNAFITSAHGFYGENGIVSEALETTGVYGLDGVLGNTVHMQTVFGGKLIE